MANSLRTVVLLVLLAFCQIALGGFARQTISNRLLENKTPKPMIDGDKYYPQVVLMPDETAALKNTPQFIDVLGNDEFSGYTLNWDQFDVLDQPHFGQAVVKGNQVEYTPNTEFTGWDDFTYSVCDFGTPIICYYAKVRVLVVATPVGPTAEDDSGIVANAPESIIVDVLANDFDKDGPFANWRSLAVLAQPEHGLATVTKDYKIEYKPIWKPNERFQGVDYIYYQICDIDIPTLCDYAVVSVTVERACTTCTSCADISEIFQDHLSTIHKVFRSEVLSI